MLATIGGILLTIGSFLIMAVVFVGTFVVAMVSQLWVLGVQAYHAIAPQIVSLIHYIQNVA